MLAAVSLRVVQPASRTPNCHSTTPYVPLPIKTHVTSLVHGMQLKPRSLLSLVVVFLLVGRRRCLSSGPRKIRCCESRSSFRRNLGSRGKFMVHCSGRTWR